MKQNTPFVGRHYRTAPATRRSCRLFLHTGNFLICVVEGSCPKDLSAADVSTRNVRGDHSRFTNLAHPLCHSQGIRLVISKPFDKQRNCASTSETKAVIRRPRVVGFQIKVAICKPPEGFSCNVGFEASTTYRANAGTAFSQEKRRSEFAV